MDEFQVCLRNKKFLPWKNSSLSVRKMKIMSIENSIQSKSLWICQENWKFVCNSLEIVKNEILGLYLSKGYEDYQIIVVVDLKRE